MRPRGRRAGTVVLTVIAAALTSAAAPAGARAATAVPPESSGATSTAAHAPGPCPAASPLRLARVDQRIRVVVPARLSALGLSPATAGLVRDFCTGRLIWSARPGAGLLPASTNKLPTAIAALRSLGPAARFRTRVTAPSRYVATLEGGGDPSLTSAMLQRLATGTASRLHRSGVRRVSLVVADGLFGPPTLAPGWQPGYYPHDVAPVRALIVDQREVMDTGLDAGAIFANLLRQRGIGVVVLVRARRVPGAAVLAEVSGSRLDSIVRTMLTRSDNDIAETLFRQTALANRYPPDWAGAAGAQRAVLASLGTPLWRVQMYDGSGLSRADRLTPQALGHLLALALDPRRLRLRAIYYEKGMPVAGLTGSLRASRGRFDTPPSSCARGRIVAKTGTLHDVVALAGVAKDANGRNKIFVLTENGLPSTLTTKRKIDAVAASITGCW